MRAPLLALLVLMAIATPGRADVPVDPSRSASTGAVQPLALASAGAVSNCDTVRAAAPSTTSDGSLSGRIKDSLAAGELLVALVLVLFGGLLTALSPCVYPLIPITLSILGARQSSSHFRGFLLSATYVGGMVILYTALGVGMAAAGSLAGSALQSPVVTVGIALFCIAMAASMFGAFELALPSALQTRLSQAGGTGFKGAFIMGLVAGIIAAPCTGPVLSFILAIIARDGDVGKGAGLMFTYALGMGLPFLVLGTFSQVIAKMPRSGKWMEVVKSIFGLMMLGAGVYYLMTGFAPVGDALSPLGARWWVGPSLLVLGTALGGLHLAFKMSSPAEKARKGVGLVFATTGLVAFLAWSNSGPAPDVTAAEGKGVPAIPWLIVKDQQDAVARFDDMLLAAKRACRPVMIDFFAEWCIACKELDHKTYVDARVRQEALRFTSIKVDATDESAALDEIQQRFGVLGLPTIAFIDGAGGVLHEPRVTGFVDANTYVGIIKGVR
jgi:thiol:disulfide interchange protein DsbD